MSVTKITSRHLTNAEASAYLTAELGTPQTAYWLADNRRGRHDDLIPHIRVGRRVYYKRRDLQSFVNRTRHRASRRITA